MTIEEKLIRKAFYEKFIEDESKHPVQVLGEAFYLEQNKDIPELSDIRFAQGEVYFLNRDLEAAIHKWENVTNELEPWAKKNIADAYLELELLSTAEDIYNSINTESMVLTTEVALQLFSLYIQREKLDLAVKVIKKVVSLNPGYPNVTTVARLFFEEQEDWTNAIELAVNEAIRTENVQWFDVIKTYVEKDLTTNLQPNYFYHTLEALYKTDSVRFEQLVCALWSNFEKSSFYLPWVKEINQFLLNSDISNDVLWKDLSDVHKETYLELISGKYLIKEIEDILPGVLTNWVKISRNSEAVFASAALLAWGDNFPSTLDESVLSLAENCLANAGETMIGMDDHLKLFDSIVEWAEDHDLEVGPRLKWMVSEIEDDSTNHLLIAATSRTEKQQFINHLLGEHSFRKAVPALVMYKYAENYEVTEISDTAENVITNMNELYEQMAEGRRRQKTIGKACMLSHIPSDFLLENKLSIVDVPSFNETLDEKKANYLHFGDSLLYVLNSHSPFNDLERDILLKIRDSAPPGLNIHFLLNKTESLYSEQELIQFIDETCSKVNVYFPKAKVFTYSTRYNSGQQLNDLSEFIQSHLYVSQLEAERTEKLLYFVRESISHLLKNRADAENYLLDSIEWNEDMLSKFQGANNQIADLEKDKILEIKDSYRFIKEEIKQEITKELPNQLRKCSELVTEDSDFSKMHILLNDEMNNRIEQYLQDHILTKFHSSIHEWIALAKEELNQSKVFLDEMSTSFNTLYGEERLMLNCDFNIIEDWRRDSIRMTSGVQIEKANILLRFTPTQFLLKSAGKIFGVLPQNKTMLYNQYKKLVENEDYTDVVAAITSKFLLPFEMFEKALERDVKMFFLHSHEELKDIVVETEQKINENQETLNKMRANPEIFQDPLTLFELRLRQHEWLTLGNKMFQHIS